MRINRDRGVFVCDHCGTEREAPAVATRVELLEESATACPACGRPLWSARLDGYGVLCCAYCSGMLIEMGQFVSVVAAARARDGGVIRTILPRQQQPGHRALNCPTCGQVMLNHLYGGPGNVVIDSCEPCSVNWLDAGELRRIAIAPEINRTP